MHFNGTCKPRSYRKNQEQRNMQSIVILLSAAVITASLAPQPQQLAAARPQLLTLRGGIRGDLEQATSTSGQPSQEAEQAADAREAELTCDGSRLHQIERESLLMTDAALDNLVSRAMAKTTDRRVLPAWNGQASWLWRQWSGTIFETAWPRAVVSMVLSALLVAALWATTPRDQLQRLSMPDPAHPLVARLKVISGMWDLQLTLTTFVTTFFMSHAYAFWRKAYTLARTIQGRMSDIAMVLSTSAHIDGATGQFHKATSEHLDTTVRRLSALHVLFWAGMVRRAPASDYHGHSLNQLLSRKAMDRLVVHGFIAAVERDALLEISSNPRGWHLAILSWVLRDAQTAYRDGLLLGGSGVESALLESGMKVSAQAISHPRSYPRRTSYPAPNANMHPTILVSVESSYLLPFHISPGCSCGRFSAPYQMRLRRACQLPTCTSCRFSSMSSA